MKPVIGLVTLLVLGAPPLGQAQTPPAGVPPHHAGEGKPVATADVPSSLVGRWRSSAFELELTSDLHRSVYGPAARSVRTTEMIVRPSGDGTFTVTNVVRDRRGQVVPGTRSVEELTFAMGTREDAPGGRARYSTRVVRGERRYLDEPVGTFPLDGAQLEVYLPQEAKGPIEVRFDTPEGSGSFWETLRPAAATPRAPAAKPAAPAGEQSANTPARGR